MSRHWLGMLFVGLLLTSAVDARVEVHDFDDVQQEARYDQLVAELRCLVCQNQNLADSNAELAVDMRRKTYQLVKQGKSNEEVVDFMVQRYGDFVRYRPPLNRTTLLLWIGPFIVLLIGVALLMRTIHKRRSVQADGIDADKLREAAFLLDTKDDKRDA